MKDKLTVILIAIIVVLAVLLVVNVLQTGNKLKQMETQIAVLNDMIMQKDSETNRIISELQSKQAELDSANKELENVKTELSNTVIRLQSLSPTAQ